MEIASTVKTIGNYMCDNCKTLETVTIKGTVDEIGVLAFDTCLSLKTVYYHSTIPPKCLGGDSYACNGCQFCHDFDKCYPLDTIVYVQSGYSSSTFCNLNRADQFIT